MKKHHYNTQPTIKGLLQQRASLQDDNNFLRHGRDAALQTLAAAKQELAVNQRQRQFVKALKWKCPMTDDVEIQYAVRVPRDQVVSAHDAEYVWIEALTQIGVAVTSDLAKHSMAAVRSAIAREQGQTFIRAKREWMMSDLMRQTHVRYEDVSTAWDMAVTAILDTAKNLPA